MSWKRSWLGLTKASTELGSLTDPTASSSSATREQSGDNSQGIAQAARRLVAHTATARRSALAKLASARLDLQLDRIQLDLRASEATCAAAPRAATTNDRQTGLPVELAAMADCFFQSNSQLNAQKRGGPRLRRRRSSPGPALGEADVERSNYPPQFEQRIVRAMATLRDVQPLAVEDHIAWASASAASVGRPQLPEPGPASSGSAADGIAEAMEQIGLVCSGQDDVRRSALAKLAAARRDLRAAGNDMTFR